jgi:Asp-tRNA(Asn)/Glu-tRNA(Gln) amidotransferase A subunit family amidase
MPFSRTIISVEESRACLEVLEIEPTGVGSLNGLRFAVTDLIDRGGYKTGCGHPDWARTQPVAAAYAVCGEQLLAAGAQCAGKTVSDELAFSLDGENSFFDTLRARVNEYLNRSHPNVRLTDPSRSSAADTQESPIERAQAAVIAIQHRLGMA